MSDAMIKRLIRSGAGLALCVGALLPPRALVAHGLPAAYQVYQAGYVQGLWILKALLIGGGLLGWVLAQRLAAVFRS